MSTPKTHTGIVVTKDGQKTGQLRETYDKFTGRRVGAPLTKRRLVLGTIKPLMGLHGSKYMLSR